MSKVTRKQRVLDAMRGYGSITPFYAINHLGDTRLAATIHTLKTNGHIIETTMETGTNKFGDQIRFAKYTLVKEMI